MEGKNLLPLSICSRKPPLFDSNGRRNGRSRNNQYLGKEHGKHVVIGTSSYILMQVKFVDGWLLSLLHSLEFIKRSSLLMVSMSCLWKKMLPLHSAPNVDVEKVLRSSGIKIKKKKKLVRKICTEYREVFLF